MKVAILGTGAYGLSLGISFFENTKDIIMWTKLESELEELQKYGTNKKVLPDTIMPSEIKYTTSMKEAVEDANLIVIAVPAKFVDNVSCELNEYYKDQHICLASKGIEQDTCLFVVDVLKKYIDTDKVAIISGPSFAIDIVKKIPIGLSLGTTNKETEKILKNTLQNKYLKLRTTNDILGIEICGSIKNVIAIASGMISGMGLPESTQAMFITESLHDIKELIKALGGDGKTILSFAGFGDLLLTSTSYKSRNFTFGRMIGKKLDKEVIGDYINNTTVEGLYTLKSIHKLINDRKVDIPIIDLIYNIVFNGLDPINLQTFLINKK
ncbi:MAG: NAD(P)H-dependent glycerol-3-phosphate dehydrogenase [Bacilli bacterium]|nr:NAD(P)H-dependent glycerol-3-phosphate dehydrogenase [Bacilli bacterium]MDD4733796.1 NAD(P)H-dependent glycerol-3-phosphate dehydrogenase [Bacilli bacterium]